MQLTVKYTSFNCKAVEVTEIEKRSVVARIIDGDNELKNITGRIPETTPRVVSLNKIFLN